MALLVVLRGVCDQCGDTKTLPTARDELDAVRVLRKWQWLVMSDFYGNQMHFCNKQCRDEFVQANGVQWNETKETARP